MKKFLLLPIAAAFVLVASCEKPQTDAEKNAQIEKEVQARLDAEHMTQDQKRMAQQQADLDAREKALADKEASTPQATATVAETVRERARETSARETSSVQSQPNESSPPHSYDTFYRKLEPYGAWRETETYGYVFQPQEAQSRGWRPYTNGRWAYTDAGWTWVSDEPFGWATYHYGRWTRLNNVGWVWVPGEEWAPAWVSWREGDRNLGWAPLPPEAHFDRKKGIHKWADNYYDIDAGEYVFIPNEDIGAENVQRSVLPEDRNVTIVNETTNVTDITYSNTTIVNAGPNFDRLREHSHRPLERMHIQREYNPEQNGADRASVHGATIQMVTPLFTARATERPRTSGPALRATTVERSTFGNPAEAERARAKMRSEATPPPDAPQKKFQRPTAPQNLAVPVASAAPVATPAPVARPTFTPRALPVATAAPSASVTATIAPTPARNHAAEQEALRAEQLRQRQEAAQKAMENRTPRATPIPTAAPTASVTATVAPTPVRNHAAEQEALRAEQLRQRQEAAQKAMEKRAPRATPIPTAVPTAPVTATVAPTPVRNHAAEQEALRAEQLRQRQEAAQKAMEKRAPRATPIPTAAPTARPAAKVEPTPVRNQVSQKEAAINAERLRQQQAQKEMELRRQRVNPVATPVPRQTPITKESVATPLTSPETRAVVQKPAPAETKEPNATPAPRPRGNRRPPSPTASPNGPIEQ